MRQVEVGDIRYQSTIDSRDVELQVSRTDIIDARVHAGLRVARAATVEQEYPSPDGVGASRLFMGRCFPTEAESHGAHQELHYTGVVTVVTCIFIAAPHNAGASRVPVSLI
jgi:hypothetical protein